MEKIDEIDRIAVHLPSGATLYGTPNYIALTLDRASEHTEVTRLLPEHAPLRYLTQYELIDALCGSRAQWTIDGRLHCRGARISPEHYLGLWRKALSAPVTAQELYDERGLSLVARLTGPLNDGSLMDRYSGWTCCPFKTYRAFYARFKDRMQPDGDLGVSFDIDLAEPDGARDAFYARSLLSCLLRPGVGWSAKLSLVADGDLLGPVLTVRDDTLQEV